MNTFARTRSKGIGLPTLASIGIILASLMLGATVSRSAATDLQPAACERPLDVVLIIDRSGSMDLVTDGQSRLGWAKDAANNLVTALNDNGGVGGTGLHQVGLTTYGNRDNSDGVPAGFTRDLQMGGSDATAVHNAINAYSDTAGTGNTPFRFGMADGFDNMLDGDRTVVDGVAVLQVLIFLSDGRPNPDSLDPGSRPSTDDINAYLAAADQAYGIAIGPDGQGEPLSEPDLDLMHAISNPDPANFRHVVDAVSLPNLFKDIAEELLCGDIQIEKIAEPTELPFGGGPVTYTYAVQNAQDGTPFENVVVEDDRCASVNFDGGDDNDDGLLQFGEVWNYSCTMEITEDTTNTACVEGEFVQSDGATDTACDEVTVTVGPPPPGEPDIHISKSHDAGDGTVEPGTLVTYTYEVENTGDVALLNVDVIDWISDSDNEVACEPVERGDDIDGNDDDVLDVGEIWGFSCSTELKVTTENTACVTADVAQSDESIEDCDDEQVEVSHSPSASPTPTQSAEGSVGAGTGTPEESLPDGALSLSGGAGALPTIFFGFVLVASLGSLAYANVRATRRRL